MGNRMTDDDHEPRLEGPTAADLRTLATSTSSQAVQLAVQQVLVFAKRAAESGYRAVVVDLSMRAEIGIAIQRQVRSQVEKALVERGFTVAWRSGDQREPCDLLEVGW